MDSRKEYIYSQIENKASRILELGPLNRPLFEKKEFPNSFTADIRSTEDVKKLYEKNDYLSATGICVDTDSIVDIDYVIKGSYANTFKDTEKFDYIVASHVVEHIPDLIGWFEDASSVLVPNGKVLLVYPDKRYSFDKFRESSVFTQALQVHQGKTAALEQRIMDFQTNVVDENDPAYWWYHPNALEHLPSKAIDVQELGKETDDVHYWPFSPTAFLKFLLDMDRAGLSDFECINFQDTSVDDQQFFVTLKKKAEKADERTDRLRELIANSLQPQDAIVQQALNKAEQMDAEAHRVYIELDKTYKALHNNKIAMEQYESERQKNTAQMETYTRKEKEWLSEKANMSISIAKLSAEKEIWQKESFERKQELACMYSAFDKACVSIANSHSSVQASLQQLTNRDALLEQQFEREKSLQQKCEQLELLLRERTAELTCIEKEAEKNKEQISCFREKRNALQSELDKMQNQFNQTREKLIKAEAKIASDAEQKELQMQRIDDLQKENVLLSERLQQALDKGKKHRLHIP